MITDSTQKPPLRGVTPADDENAHSDTDWKAATMKKWQERCDRCGKFVRECTLLADEENNESICAPCWSVVYPPTTTDTIQNPPQGAVEAFYGGLV